MTEYTPIDSQNRRRVNAFLTEHWLSTDMIIRGAKFDLTKADGILATENDTFAGLLTYVIHEGIFEITSLDSVTEGKGIGSALIGRAISIARETRCRKIIVVTTNDNIQAIRFYQRRGFDMARLYHNAMDLSRKLKPSIPLIGENGIPLKHEIEFEMDLAE